MSKPLHGGGGDLASKYDYTGPGKGWGYRVWYSNHQDPRRGGVLPQ